MKDAKVKTSRSSNPSGKKSDTDDIQDTAQTNHTNSEHKFVPLDGVYLKPFKGILSG